MTLLGHPLEHIVNGLLHGRVSPVVVAQDLHNLPPELRLLTHEPFHSLPYLLEAELLNHREGNKVYSDIVIAKEAGHVHRWHHMHTIVERDQVLVGPGHKETQG